MLLLELTLKVEKKLLYRDFEYTQQQKAAFLQATAGVVHHLSHKFRMLNERVVRAVATYGQLEILVYLRSVAHLSHS